MNTPAPRSDRRLRRVRAHQCSTCRTPWALRVVEHPAGKVVLCVHCGTVRSGTREDLRAVSSGGQAYASPTDRGVQP